MSDRSKNTSTRSLKRRASTKKEDVESDVLSDGEVVAKIFKYYRGWQNPFKKTVTPFKLVSGKKIYKQHKDAFDAFAAKAKACKFDVDSYLKYCVINRGINESCVLSCLTSTLMLNEYYNHKKREIYLNNVYNWFMKSVKNIVAECIESETYTTKDFLRHLIKNNLISIYVASGKLSIYYLAAIPSFNKVIDHLDHFSRLELQQLKDHFEIYHSDVNEAFLLKKHKMVNPIELTDLAILKSLKKL